MRRILTATTILAITALAGQAQAMELQDPIAAGFSEVMLLTSEISEPVIIASPLLKNNASIAVARLDGGRMIPTPYVETVDWKFLDRRTSHTITQLGAGNYIKYIPEIPYPGQDTDNKIDEVRLTAANEGFDYVLIYGVGPDAGWASFGKKALSETGLNIDQDCKSWDEAKAKALLVDSFSGKVLGAVTADNIEFNIGELADRTGEMISNLSAPKTTEA